jgi:aspartate aminotransferase
MIELASRLNRIVESNTLRMAKLSRELQAQGKDVINLSLGAK